MNRRCWKERTIKMWQLALHFHLRPPVPPVVLGFNHNASSANWAIHSWVIDDSTNCPGQFSGWQFYSPYSSQSYEVSRANCTKFGKNTDIVQSSALSLHVLYISDKLLYFETWAAQSRLRWKIEAKFLTFWTLSKFRETTDEMSERFFRVIP